MRSPKPQNPVSAARYRPQQSSCVRQLREIRRASPEIAPSNPTAFANLTKSGKFSPVCDIDPPRNTPIRPESSPPIILTWQNATVAPTNLLSSQPLTSKISKNSPPQAPQNSTHQNGSPTHKRPTSSENYLFATVRSSLSLLEQNGEHHGLLAFAVALFLQRRTDRHLQPPQCRVYLAGTSLS